MIDDPLPQQTQAPTESVRVSVRLGEPLRRAVGAFRRQITLSAPATLADLLDHLVQTYPDFAARFRGEDLGRDHPYHLFVNHRQALPGEFACFALADGDQVHIVIPALGGGP